MGDVRYERRYRSVATAADRTAAIRALSDEDIVAALAASREEKDPLLANVLASEAQNRVRRKGAILETAVEGLLSQDVEGKLTYINPAAERMLGWTFQELHGRRIHDVIHFQHPDGEPYPQDECPIARVALTGEELRGQETMLTRKDGSTFAAEQAAAPILRDGQIEGIVVTFTDITERKRVEREREESLAREREARARAEEAERRSRFMARASAVLGASLDYVTTLRQFADLVVPDVADACGVYIADETGQLRTVATAHGDPSKRALAEAVLSRSPGRPNTPSRRAIDAEKPELVAEITDAVMRAVAEDEEHLRLLREFDMGSAIFVPLSARGKIFGVTFFLADKSRKRYDDRDVAFAEELASRAALAVDNARLYSSAQREIAHREHAEAALRHSEEQYRRLYDESPTMYFTLNEEHTIVSLNRFGATYLGYDPADLVGQPFSTVVDPDDHETVRDHLEDLFREPWDGTREWEGRKRRKDGSRLWVREYVTATKDAAGRTFALVNCLDITQQKHAEEALRLSQERYRQLVESVEDYAIFMLDPQGGVVSWNAGAERRLGYTEQEALGKHFSLFYPVESIAEQRPQRALEAAARDGHAEDEGWRIRKDGEKIWASVVLTALHDDNDALIGFSQIMRELTDRRAAEEALRESEERYRLLVNSVQDYAIFMLDPQGTILSWNQGAETLKGYSPAEIIGRHFSVFYTPPDIIRGHPQWELAKAAEEGRYIEEGWRVRKNGSRFWARIVLTRILDDEGKLVGFSKVTQDLTERRQADETLRQSEERYRLLVESVKDYALFMLDTQGRITSWNVGAERLKGYSAREAIGKHFSMFYTPEDVARGHPQHELALASNHGSYEEEGWRVRKDGSRFWASVVITAVRDPDGTLLGFAKVTQDLTNRQRGREHAVRPEP